MLEIWDKSNIKQFIYSIKDLLGCINLAVLSDLNKEWQDNLQDDHIFIHICGSHGIQYIGLVIVTDRR